MAQRKAPSPPTRIKVAVDHGGKCALCGPYSPRLYPNLEDETFGDIKVGKFAHIHSETTRGPRYDPTVPKDFLKSRFNFLYACEDHHNLIDSNTSTFDATLLKAMRKEHSRKVEERLPTRSKQRRYAIVTLEDSYFGVINRSTMLEAIQGEGSAVANLEISLKLNEKDIDLDWIANCMKIKKKWDQFVERVMDDDPAGKRFLIDEFHVFSITKIPFAIYLGALIQETNIVRLYQWRRRIGEQTWAWDASTLHDSYVHVDESPKNGIAKKGSDVIVKVEISDAIHDHDIKRLFPRPCFQYSVRCDAPNRHWLQTEKQFLCFCVVYRELIRKINQAHPGSMVHLFFAGPVPLAIFIGQIFNPRMDRPLIVYNWQANKDNVNNYVHVFELGQVLSQAKK